MMYLRKAGNNGLVAVSVIILFAVLAFILGRASSPSRSSTIIAPKPTATPLIPTPTPNLTLQSPRVIAAWQSSSGYAGCDGCWSITFTSKGPFDMLAACNPFQVFAGTDPSIELRLFDSNGHLIDTVEHTCGDPNQDKVMTDVIPEQLPAGQYQLQVSPSGASVTVLILDASPV